MSFSSHSGSSTDHGFIAALYFDQEEGCLFGRRKVQPQDLFK